MEKKNNIALSGALIVALLMITAFLPQMQMIFFGGNVYVPNGVLSLLSLYLSFVYMLYVNRIKFNKKISTVCLFFLFYLVIGAAYHLFFLGRSLSYIALGYNQYYIGVVILLLYLSFEDSISDKSMLKIFAFLSAPLIFIGIMQFSFNDPILHVSSVGGNFVIFSWRYFDHVRAFSFFKSAADFGYFLSIVLSAMLCIFICVRHAYRLLLIPLIMIVVLCIYATYTRQVYLMSFCSVISLITILLAKKMNNKFTVLLVKLMPLLYGVAMSLSVFFVVYHSMGELKTSSLDNASSLLQRVVEWDNIYTELESKPEKLFLGTGVVQGRADGSDEKKIIIDNTILAVIYQIGIIGFLLFIALFISCWTFLLRKSMNTRSPLLLSIASVFSTFGMSWIIGVNIYIYLIIAIIGLVTFCKKDNEVA